MVGLLSNAIHENGFAIRRKAMRNNNGIHPLTRNETRTQRRSLAHKICFAALPPQPKRARKKEKGPHDQKATMQPFIFSTNIFRSAESALTRNARPSKSAFYQPPQATPSSKYIAKDYVLPDKTGGCYYRS
ncbi:hypothetical protein [Gordonibacter massiliensis (ex Traore et al. 2017)]|uniref:Uncharacterized protein n=1 Tax=Gordonibacter massiliensis (ex Traore et al. 2017) TaxID=1841863 RepID=A0A842JE20_9ACTN|nr:hypothetical protein [Gordonibacter massiliensis (ex Traore et al. 2017)]MBC2889927.1 hypothetical protein [Gordonibacter massiliensis (ex Traore et al. 2017)]